ncbi:hypothetical protein FHW36_109151 [Chitinophaga polysaccharea]|uniref:GH25 family protein n=1 Tax=Chitinophaga polysaccharea TaxID=1293035 RepID=A0A561PB45_9BACT|nr:hypothetical protein [Chitinophaga polysaccharea]TWF35361.1 hypothetical protein FHW36_109151 [Chitinophaga polysaccharea]
MKQLLLSVILFFCVLSVRAHAIWIETSTTGKTGQSQEVNVFFGEYADNERDSVQHWFSNMKEFTLYLVTPDGKKEKLPCVPEGNHFKAVFTPAAAGAHTLLIDHTVADLYSGSKIHYYALGLVKVNGSLQGVDHLKTATDLGLVANHAQKHKTNQPENIQLHYKQQPLPTGLQLAIQSPAGWTKKYEAGKQGTVAFTPVWAGRYLLEGTYTENEKGEQAGKPYERIWHCVTYCMDVEK